MKKAIVILTWVIGIMFIATGISKLAGVDQMSMDIFNRAKYPGWLFYVTGIVELTGGILILIRSFRMWGYILISLVMLGAIFSHIYIGDNLMHCIVSMLIILFSFWRIKERNI